MPVLIRQTSGTVHVDASTVDLAGAELVVEFEPEWTGNGLVEADPAGDGARILCGQEIGSIAVTAQLWDGAPPPVDDPGSWQDAAEVSVAWHSPFVDFGTTGDGDDPAHRLALPGPGTYRLRVHGRHRDDGDPREDEDPQEEYLIQVWAAPDDVADVIKATSETARGWRA
ncbi:hypothetical protein AB0A70_16595 [Streptomyces morookaense]|uniref:hypothetical protein n=1 Tax=Streptomyces morookaense TaxID=1970 RepID=UPI00340D4504